MSRSEYVENAENGQTSPAQESVYDKIKKLLDSLGIPASPSLATHAATTVHEELPYNHECDASCKTNSLGTTTPISVQSINECPYSRTPPTNFGVVLPDAIYRSSYPHVKSYEFLQDLGIKTILTLVPETISSEYRVFMEEVKIQHFQVHIRANKGEVSVEPCQMSRALRLLMDRNNHPILVHCNKGKHRTGCTIASFRRILGWNLGKILTEYHVFAGAKARIWDEHFFENFDLNLVLWFARQEGWAPSPEPGSNEDVSEVVAVDSVTSVILNGSKT